MTTSSVSDASAKITFDSNGPTVVISTAGGATNQPVQTISGTVTDAESTPGAVVALYDNGSTRPIGTALVGADGTWSVPVALVNGTNSIVAENTDAAGNTGTSSPLIFTVDTLPPTVSIANAGGLTNQASQTISGTVTSSEATPGSTVTLYDSGSTTPLGTTILQSDGTWSTPVTLAIGTNSIVAEDTDAAGNTGLSAPVIFSLGQSTAIAQHFGSINPASEGFTNDLGGPVLGSSVIDDSGLDIDAWNISGSSATSYNQYVINGAEATALGSENWTFTVEMRNLSPQVGEEIYADVIIDNQRYDIGLQDDGFGYQTLLTNTQGSGPQQSYLIPGLGTNYALFQMVYNASTKEVDYFVNGTLVIANNPGYAEAYAPIVFFGGTDGNFSLVQLQTGNPAIPAPLVIAAPASATVGLGQADAINGISLAESGNTGGEIFSVSLSDTTGVLSANTSAMGGGGTITSSDSGKTLTLTGSLDQVNADLATVTDAGERAGSDTVTITAGDSNGNLAVPAAITVEVNGPPLILAPALTAVTQGRATSIRGITVSEEGDNATFSVTVADADGELSASGSGVSGAGSTSLTITGLLGQVNSDLSTVTDTDNSAALDTLTVTASDSFGNSAVETGFVAVNRPPVLLTPAMATVTQDLATSVVLVSLSEVGDTANEIFSVSVSDSTGLLSATGTGVSGAGTTQLTVTGSLAQVNDDLETLTDREATSASDTITVTASDSLGNQVGPQSIAVSVAPLTLGGLEVIAANTGSATIDWSSLETSLKPPFIDSTDWGLIWDRYTAAVGGTIQSLLAPLSKIADVIRILAGPIPADPTATQVAPLVTEELEQASGVLPNITLANTTDLAPAGSGLDLSLTRTYGASLLNRNNPGPFGDGWTFTYDITAVTDASGNVYITSPSGAELFTLQSNGTYAAQAGDLSTLTLSGGAYVLTDINGTVERFLPDGQIGSITDANGNTLDISYNGAGIISSVVSSNGQSLIFTTNAEGRITSATDQDGQQTTYTYDAGGNLLLSVSGPNGATSYAYDSSGNPYDENALTQITNPNGTTESFQYDEKGDLISRAGTDRIGQVTYGYPGNGTVTETDAAGNTTTLTFDTNGNLAETMDPLGNVTQYEYNSDNEPTSVVTPSGATSSYSYDANGNITGYTDPDGGRVSETYAPGTDLLTSLTDQNGNKTNYSYNSAGDRIGITYDDGSGTTYQYSPSGLLTSSTDARGQTTTYTYDAQGLLTRETFSDGTFQAYAYNAQGKLISAQATNGGVTTYGYNAAGELTGVTNPGGQVESYTYNSGGQELTRTEPDGSVTQYSYNAAGQLAEIQDGSGNPITQYTYNALGQLVGSLDGNGQTTDYQYDADGNVTQILTEAVNGTVTSRLNYTYNSDGQAITATSLDGTWTYTHDAEGQITNAVFVSTNASIPNQNLTYEYDAAGNLTKTIFNGAVNNYTTNGLNQYTASDGTTYDYDADGNLVSVTQNGATTTYTYNSQNQLIAQSGPSGNYTYTYDALGNLVSSTDNGVVSNYIIDSLAIDTSATGPLSAIAQVYNASDDVTATYDYGNGLAAEITGGGTYYYNTDAMGNVISLSGADGSLIDTYEYTPFGTLAASTGNVSNLFQYEGDFGVATESSGLLDAAARFYDPALGRFISIDPLGLLGSLNLYEFVDNDPVGAADPTGLLRVFTYQTVYVKTPGNVNVESSTTTKIYSDGTTSVVPSNSVNVGSISFGSDGSTTSGKLTLTSLGPQGVELDFETWNNNLNASGGFGIELNRFDLALLGLSAAVVAALAAEGAGAAALAELGAVLVNRLAALLEAAAAALGPSPALAACAGGLGCPHFTTFDGLAFDFQGAGEFIAAKSTVPGNSFQVQMRIEPQGSEDSGVSIITQIAVQVGNDRVTFGVPQNGDASRPSLVMVDGAPVAISASNPVFTLQGGTVTEVSSNEYQVALNTGEVVTVNPFGDGMGFTIRLSLTDGPGSIEGFLGPDKGQANDFQLPDGTVLPQPLTQDELYQTFANAWRVTDASSLLDYGPGQDTGTFTNAQYPREILTLADFPPALVAQAAALVAAAGITDPTLAADAEFDYITMGNPSFITDDASVAAENPTVSTPTVITQQVTPPPSVGVFPVAPDVVQTGGATTPVTFVVNLTGAATTDTVVDYAVALNVDTESSGTSGKVFFDASDFGGTLPSGSVTISAGQTEAEVTIAVPNSALGSAPDKWLGISISAPGGNLVYDPTGQTEIVHDQPVPGVPAEPAIELLSSGAIPLSTGHEATATQAGNSYTFDLGRVVYNAALPSLQFAIANTVAPGGDDLSSLVSAMTGTGFAVSGTELPVTIAAGSAYSGLYLQPETTSLGPQSATITLTSYDVNDTGYSASLPNLTLTVEDTVIAPAAAAVASSLTFPNVRVGTAETQTLAISNSAPESGADLDATLTAGPGTSASGSVSQLAPGASDDSDLSVGLTADAAGLDTGTVTLNVFSDLGNGAEVPALPSPTVTLSGSVFRTAAGSIAPVQAVVHVGDPDTEDLVVSNTDPADGFSEGLLASLISSSGAISTSGGPTGLIAAGSSDSTSLQANFSTATAGIEQGGVTVDFQTDGTGTSGLGTLDLGTSNIPISITVNNYAQASIDDLNGVGNFHQNGKGYTLDLGTIAQGAAAPTVELGVANSAIGPADLLSGSFSVSGDSVFTNSGFDPFSGLAVDGPDDTAPTVTLATGTPGSFSEIITLAPTGTNASGYSGALAPVTLTITGTVAAAANQPPPPPVPDDFTGNSVSGLLWQNADGTPGIWLMNAAAPIGEVGLTDPGSSWKIVGSGDFNGDGKADILWQNTDGTPGIWLMNGTTPFAEAGLSNPGPSWQIVASGDFTGNGRSDILWQNADGTLGVWLMNGTTPTAEAAIGNPGPNWNAIGAADFTGNGIDDILLQNTATGDLMIDFMNGTTVTSSTTVSLGDPSWNVIGAGEFDGQAAIFFQNTNGEPGLWLMNGATPVAEVGLANPGPGWQLISAGQFTNNGQSDLLFQNSNGTPMIWEMNGTSVVSQVTLSNSGSTWQLKNGDPASGNVLHN